MVSIKEFLKEELKIAEDDNADIEEGDEAEEENLEVEEGGETSSPQG